MHCQVCHFGADSPDETVCRRCARNFTRAELKHVVLIALAYFLLCRFSFYLLTGNLFAGLWKGSLAGPFNMASFFVLPVNLADYPLHLLTLGWILALVLVVPVIVGTVFGTRPGVIVALLGGLFAGVPFLFLVSVPAAYAAATRFNGRFDHAKAAWIALSLPVLFALAFTAATLPEFSIGFLAVWFVALSLAAFHLKLALFLIERLNLAGTFLVKLVLPEALAALVFFYVTVGFDAVEYNCTRSRAWVFSERFGSRPGPDTLGATPETIARLLREHVEAMEPMRRQSLDDFERFSGIFPRSKFTALALFEMAEIHNVRLYVASTRPFVTAVATDRISPESVPLYQRILRDFNDSIAAAYARLKLAEFDAQHGLVAEAAQRYADDVAEVYKTHLPADYVAGKLNPVELETSWRSRRFSSAMQKLAYYYVMQCARDRRDFIERNSDFNCVPLALYLQADPRSDDFLDRIADIPQWFPSSAIVDNILWDRACRGNLRLDDLLNLYAQYPHGDVAPAVLLELAGRYLKERTYDPAKARKFYDVLLRDFPESPEAARARTEVKPLLDSNAPPVKAGSEQ